MIMLTRKSSTGRSGRIGKKQLRYTGTEKQRDNHQIEVNLKLFSPTKAARWDPRHASTDSPSNYTLTMVTESDVDEDDQDGVMAPSDTNSENVASDLEGYNTDWEKYVDPCFQFEWLEMIEGEVTFQRNQYSPVTRIAKCKAYLIRRSRIADSFWNSMNKLEFEAADLAFEIFDRYGCLQPNFKNHPIKRGSGVWNDELNDGDILMIDDILVSRPNRRKGIGSKLVHAILDLSAKKSRVFFALTPPEYKIGEFEQEGSPNGASTELPIYKVPRFWRKLGFRRIGSSRWLGYTPDPNHPSHIIALEQDFDILPFQRISITREMACLTKALPTIDDTECLTQLKNIFEDISLDDTRWEARDDNGNTFLHLVSCSSKTQSTRWLIRSNPNLCHALNATGSTPLDALEEEMNQNREIRRFCAERTDISVQFAGFKPATTSCYALLKGLAPETLSEAEMSRLKFGCTCGNCIGGFLSPRMRDILLKTAETTYDFIYKDSDHDNAKEWCKENQDVFRYLPEHILHNFQVNKDMIIGFCMLWNHLASCLRNSMLPTDDNILLLIRNGDEWPPHCRNFLQNGGSISSVATMLFWKAMKLEEKFGLEYGESDSVFQNGPPSCRNDREFGLVSAMCGYERVARVEEVDMHGKRIRY